MSNKAHNNQRDDCKAYVVVCFPIRTLIVVTLKVMRFNCFARVSFKPAISSEGIEGKMGKCVFSSLAGRSRSDSAGGEVDPDRVFSKAQAMEA